MPDRQYQITLTRAQIRILIEALTLYRQMLRGEFHLVANTIAEKNRQKALTKGRQTPEAFDQRVQALKAGLRPLEPIWTKLPQGRYLNILRIGPWGQLTVRITRKIEMIGVHPATPSMPHTIAFTEDELQLLGRCAEFYARILMGEMEAIAYPLTWAPQCSSTDQMAILVQAAALNPLATGLDDTLFHGICSNVISHKARWCWDIHQCIESAFHHWQEYQDVIPFTYPHKLGTEPMPSITPITKD